MIYEEIDESLFISRFEDFKRVETDEKGGNFTYKGLRYLFNYLDDLSEDTDENIQLDVIALCCDFSEYKDIKEYLRDYGNQHEVLKKEIENLKDTFEEKTKKENLLKDLYSRLEEEINEKTTLIKFSDDLNEGFIIGSY